MLRFVSASSLDTVGLDVVSSTSSSSSSFMSCGSSNCCKISKAFFCQIR